LVGTPTETIHRGDFRSAEIAVARHIQIRRGGEQAATSTTAESRKRESVMVRRLTLPLAAFVIILSVSIGFERTFSTAFQQCVKSEREKTARPDDNQPTRIGSVIDAYVVCSGNFVDSHGSGITALATLIIAAFTGTLWIATSRQAKLTENALELLERAYVDVLIKQISVGEQQIGYETERVVNVSYQLQNLGRSVAIVTELHQEIRFSDSRSRLPDPQRGAGSKLRRTLSIAPERTF
jgi:hypothetical protein